MAPAAPHWRRRGMLNRAMFVVRIWRALLIALLTALPGASGAFTVSIAAGTPTTIYLQVGVGTFSGGNYNAGGTPGNNTTINNETVAVAAGAVGNGVAQAMTTDSTAANSFYDGFLFCTATTQLYIGGFYRTSNGGGNTTATVTATVPAALTDGAGHTIPFSQIRWTSSGNADGGAEPFPAASFSAGGVQTVGTIAKNNWAESCWTFSYLNSNVPVAGTYTGRVTYTLSTP